MIQAPIKVIFLDYDGVINTESVYNAWRHGHKPDDMTVSDFICPVCVSKLNQIIDSTGAQVVLSSAWRKFHSLQWNCDHIRKFGYTGPDFLSQTLERFSSCTRALEIADWLRNNEDGSPKWNIKTYCVLDDRDDANLEDGSFVQTTEAYGLQDSHVLKAIEILNRKDHEKKD